MIREQATAPTGTCYYGVCIQLAGQPPKMDQTELSMVGEGVQAYGLRIWGTGAKHDSSLTAGLMLVADTHPDTHTHPRCTHACCLSV